MTMAADDYRRMIEALRLAAAAIDALLDAMDNHEGCTSEYSDAEVAARQLGMTALDDVRPFTA